MNADIKILKKEVLSDDWYTLNKITYRQRLKSNVWTTQSREAYDRGNGAAILLYDKVQNRIVLTKQFRLPTYINGNTDGMLIEVCAGLLDGDHPEQAIIREVEEETGYSVHQVEKVFELYMSPGSVTELIHFFIANYSAHDKTSEGGGVGDEEPIEVLELSATDAIEMVHDGRIVDGKTVILIQYLELLHSKALNTG